VSAGYELTNGEQYKYENNDLFCNGSKQVIQFYYNGGSRLVEPCYYGMDKAGNELLRGYQISGYSKSGDTVGWKLFRASRISNLVVTGKHFTGIRDGYNPNDKAMTVIYCFMST